MKKPLLALLMILAVKAALMLGLVQTEMIGLGPDEAQYWTWSRELDWGYYSKPPGIAWQIRAGTALFGDTELGVRFMALVIGFLLPLSVFALARACRLKEWTAFWAGTVMALSPLGVMSSFLATTDGGMVLFWTLACIVIAGSLSRGTTPNYYLVAFCIILGALFKWPIYLLWGFVLLAMLVFPNLRSLHVLGGMVLSLAGLLPSILWNASHDWATFRHVGATIAGGHGNEAGTTPLFHGNFFEFLGAQASLLSPILFILLLFSFVALVKNGPKIWPALLFCGGTTLILLFTYAAVSLFQKIQGNWCVFAYPTGIVLLCWYACENTTRGLLWLKGGIALSVALVAALFSIPFLQAYGAAIPYKFNPFRHNVGWNTVADALLEAGYDPERDFLFGDKYQMTSILSFYGPEKKKAYFLNLQGARKNQFSYWPGMREEKQGSTGYYIHAENEPRLTQWLKKDAAALQATLQHYCNQVDPLGSFPLFSIGSQPSKGIIIFKCTHYNGKEPPDPEKF